MRFRVVGSVDEPASGSPLFDALASALRVTITPSAITGLSDFLLARIAEDENRVRNFGGVTAQADPLMNPTRALYECTAKRMIVAIHSVSPATQRCAHDKTRYPCLTLRALALPYADHPDFRVEWRS